MSELDPYTIDTSLPDVQALDSDGLRRLQQLAAQKVQREVAFHDSLGDGSPGPALVVVPPGLFEMGAVAGEFGAGPEEGPQHLVTLRYSYALGRTPVTAAEFARYQAATGFQFRRDLITTAGTQPVINLRRAEAEDYLRWLGGETGARYRLPTEAEWEYACRAGSRTAFSFGASVTCREVHFNPAFPYEEARQKRTWFLPRCVPVTQPLPVGLLGPNLWGLYDMHGNVWEFTANPWTDTHQGTPRDGSASGKVRVKRIVVKGGSYFDSAMRARSAARMPRVWDELDVNLGLRVLREL